MTGIIYKIINDINHKIYVGQTWKTAKQRFNRHCAEAGWKNTKKMPIILAIKKYGKKHFQVFVLQKIYNCSQSRLDKREIFWSNKLNTMSPNGYNLKVGSGRGTVSEETKLKISLGNKGKKASSETIEKLRISHLGHKVTDATKQKLSIINTGKKLSEEHKKKIGLSHIGKKLNDISKEKMRLKKLKYIYEVKSPTGEIFQTNNLEKFSRDNNLNSGHISSIANRKKKDYLGWTVIKLMKIRKELQENGYKSGENLPGLV